MDYPLARTGFWAGASGLLAWLASTAVLCWWAWHLQVDRRVAGTWPTLLVIGVLLAAAAALVWRWRARRHGPLRHLRFDGTGWELRAAGGEPLRLGPPAVRVDLGGALLLRATPSEGGAACWLALERSDLPAAWHALRVAVLQRRPSGAAAPGATA
ncbi:MAG: hypothetical protein U1F53_04800 [Burkholderiaceae bacterium]